MALQQLLWVKSESFLREKLVGNNKTRFSYKKKRKIITRIRASQEEEEDEEARNW